MSIRSNGDGSQTWKDYAGRADGKDSYVFGDFVRHWWNLFRGLDRESNAPRNALVDESDCALLDLKAQRDQLVGHRKRVEKLLVKDEDVARNLVSAGKKEQAMLALRKKKQHLQLISECGGHILKVEELIGSIEATRAQQEMVAALKTGIAQLKRMQREIGGAAEVQRLMDEHEELSDEMREMSDMLARSGVAADDADALAEFRKLEEEVALQAATSAAPAAAQAPAGASAAPAPAAAPAAAATSAVAAAASASTEEAAALTATPDLVAPSANPVAAPAAAAAAAAAAPAPVAPAAPVDRQPAAAAPPRPRQAVPA